MKTRRKSKISKRITRVQKGGNKNKIFVLNLDKRVDRWKEIQKKFNEYNLERVSAIENLNGHVGCGLSHIKAIKLAKEQNLPYAIIIEDDCKPTKYFNNFKIIIDWLKNNEWDTFVGGNSYYGYNQNEKDSIKLIISLDENCNIYKTRVQSAHFIIYNAKIYDRIINEWEQNEAIDLISNKLNLNSLCCVPFIAIQEDGYSNIEKTINNTSNVFEISEKIISSIKFGGEKIIGYVINLDERKDRWEQIQKDFKNTSINIERFSAIKDINGHKGVGKSFQALIQMAKDKNMESILIMEDDCKPLKYFEKRWKIIKKWLDENKDKWNIFNGGPLTPSEQKLLYKIDSKNKIYTSNGASALHFMIFSKESYDTILNWSFEKDSLLDWYINRETNKYIYIDPPIVLQHTGLSDTNNKIKNFTNNSYNQGSYSKIKTDEANKLYKNILINYADKGFIESRRKLKESALNIGGLDEVIEYGPNDIDESFKKECSKHFENTRGAGLWIWKPYLILKTLNKMDEEDILVYCDAGATFTDSIIPYIEKMKDSIMLFYAPYKEWSSNEYTKMDVFKELNCMENKNVTHGTQIEAGFIILKNNNKSKEFIQKWLDLVKNYHLISDEPSIEPNFPEFKEHRHDQSLLSALGKLYKDTYNIDIEEKPFINHHRRHDGGKRKTIKKKYKGGSTNNILILGYAINYMFFEDYINSLTYNLKQKNITYKIDLKDSFDKNYFKNKNEIIIFLQNKDYADVDKSIIKNSFILNTEQLTLQHHLDKMKNYISEGYKIIDYSLANLELLKNNNNIKDNTLFYLPYLVNYDEIKDINKLNELSMITAFSSEHRKDIFNYVSEQNIIPIHNIEGWKEERDNQLFKYKILLNIHNTEKHKIYESMRCDRLIFNKIMIVSEKCLDSSIPEEIKPYVIEFNNKDELLSILNNIKNNYYDTIWNDFNLENISKKRLEYLEKLLTI